MLVGKLTQEQYEMLTIPTLQLVEPNWYFYPFKNNDVEYSWVISTEEINGSIYPQNDWVKTLPLVEYINPTPVIPGENYFDQFFKK